jgi:hypothetical protein
VSITIFILRILLLPLLRFPFPSLYFFIEH